MSCELDCEDLKDVGFEELVRKMVVKTEDGCYALRVIDEGTGGGGSYTFPANHGNTAYVSVDGNNATGVVGNISKPFENIGAAIAALSNTADGVIIILSSSSAQVINDYDYTTMPYNLSIFDFANTGLSCGGSCSFGTLKVRTAGLFVVNTDFLYTSDDYCDIQCDTLLIQSTAQGAITFLGIVECNNFSVPSNTNNPSITFDIIKWNKSIIEVSEPITYNRCNPMVYKAILSQSGTSAPTATVLENTTGETPTYTRSDIGTYFIDSPGSKFTTGTVMKMTVSANQGGTIFPVFSFQRTSSSRLTVECYEVSGFALGDYIGASGLAIEIEIYP